MGTHEFHVPDDLSGLDNPPANAPVSPAPTGAPDARQQPPPVDPAGITTFIDGWPRRWARSIRMPHPITHRPASVQALLRWARFGAWTRREGRLRKVWLVYYGLIFVPYLAGAYFLWALARPTRLITATVAVICAVWLLRLAIATVF